MNLLKKYKLKSFVLPPNTVKGLTITFVISPIGLGHLTRQIALLQSFVKLQLDITYRFICDHRHYSQFRYILDDIPKLKYFELPHTPNMSMETWNVVDVKSSIDAYQRFWDFETQVRDDTEWGRILYGSDIIINDIESVHNPIVNKMNIFLVNISNFTWSDIIEGFQEHMLAENYRSWEGLADLNIKLPFSMHCTGFTGETLEIGLLVREFDESKTISIDRDDNSVIVMFLFPLNDHPKHRMFLKALIANNYFILISKNQQLDEFDDLNASIKLIDPKSPIFHQYIKHADVLISKLGYGVISECLAYKTPIAFQKRSNSPEDDFLADSIHKYHLGDELDPASSIDRWISTIRNLTANNILSLRPKNDEIAKIIIEKYIGFNKKV